MNKMNTAALSFALVAGLSASAAAQDQETGAVDVSASSAGTSSSYRAAGPAGRLRFTGGLHFGGGGSLNVEVDDTDGDVDLNAIIGLQAGADYLLHDYFAIGGETRLSFWKVEDQDGRSLFWDINVKPRGRYQFNNIPLEVYGALPLGLSLVKPEDADARAGFNFGFGPGATYFFTDSIGINSEMLGVWHWFGGDEDDYPGADDVSFRTAQFYFMANAVFAL